jgi:hypothetical protein
MTGVAVEMENDLYLTNADVRRERREDTQRERERYM